MKLVVVCVECGKVTHATFDGERLPARRLFRENGYLLSLVSGDPHVAVLDDLLLAPVCETCAPKIYTPEQLVAAHQKMGVQVSELRCYYFGCWQRAGHYLWAPGGLHVMRVGQQLETFGKNKPEPAHLDGGLAPRRGNAGQVRGRLCFAGAGEIADDRRRIEYDSDECPQGQFLRHELDTGFTAISWWDRNQGDTRGACNSTILLEGKRDTEEMLEALKTRFPGVLANLDRAGVKLVEVFLHEGDES